MHFLVQKNEANQTNEQQAVRGMMPVSEAWTPAGLHEVQPVKLNQFNVRNTDDSWAEKYC